MIDTRYGVAHSDAQEKTRTFLQIRPDEKRGVVVMTNSEYGNTRKVSEVAWAVLDAD